MAKEKSEQQIIREALTRIRSVPTWLPYSNHHVSISSVDLGLIEALGLRPATPRYFHLVEFKKIQTSSGPEWELVGIIK